METPHARTRCVREEQRLIEEEDTLEITLDSKNPSPTQICKVEGFYAPPPDPIDDEFAGVLITSYDE